MNKQLTYKKTFKQPIKMAKTGLYEDEISDFGKKGGRVERERQQAHQIDLELRNLTYR